MYSFGCFPGVWLLYADVSEPSIGSIFKGWISFMSKINCSEQQFLKYYKFSLITKFSMYLIKYQFIKAQNGVKVWLQLLSISQYIKINMDLQALVTLIHSFISIQP